MAEVKRRQKALARREYELSEQRLEIDGARMALDCQWESLKTEKIVLAEKNRRLKKHLGQLGDAEQKLEEEIEFIRKERDSLQDDRQSLNKMRNQIEQVQQKLDSQRDKLQQEEARLGAERSGFEEQRQSLAQKCTEFEEAQNKVARELEAKKYKLAAEKDLATTNADRTAQTGQAFQQREELEAGREQLDSQRKRIEVDMKLLRSEREHPEEAANESANSGDDFHLEDDEDPDSVSEYMEQLLTSARKKRDHNEESGNSTQPTARPVSPEQVVKHEQAAGAPHLIVPGTEMMATNSILCGNWPICRLGLPSLPTH